MKGLILVNAYYDTPATRYQSGRIAEELKKLGVDVEVKKNDFFAAQIDGGHTIAGKNLRKHPKNQAVNFINVPECDFCVFLDKDKYAARALETSGVRLFNSREAIEVCDDKAVTFLKLAGHNIPMPKTVPGLLCYEKNAFITSATVDYIAGELGFPLVVKESYGSLGKGVFKVNDRGELESICERLKCTPHLFQQFIKESAGRDIRVTVVGGKAVSAMLRESAGDFRSNIGLGGTGRKFEIDGELKALTEKIARILCLDYCGIDVLSGKDGYLLCEVNSNAFFGGSEEATGVNIAKAYAEHIVSVCKSHK